METANELFWNGIFSFTNSLYVIQLMYVDVYPCLHVVISNLEYNVLSVMQIGIPLLSYYKTFAIIGRLVVFV